LDLRRVCKKWLYNAKLCLCGVLLTINILDVLKNTLRAKI
jgi:hypothetical protein